MQPIILFRKDFSTEEEFEIAKQYFDVVQYRSEVPRDSLVVGRYSFLPFYNELEKDVRNLGSTLINSYEQHLWIANMDYYYDLQEYTPETWSDHDFYRCDYDGPFVVKGRTNSRKHQWNSMMFAQTKKDAIAIGSKLFQDSLIQEQGVVYRKYVPLKTFEIGINGLPFTNEWRFFYYKTTRLSYAYYWTTAEKPELAQMTDEGLELADRSAEIAAENVNFFVIDIAETQAGDWIVVEINDGSQSGLSYNDPHALYSNLKKLL